MIKNFLKKLYHLLFSMDFLKVNLENKEDKQIKIKFEKKGVLPSYSFYSSGFSYDYIVKHANEFDWLFISSYYDLDEYTIYKLQDYLDWYEISKHQQMTKEMIEHFTDKVDWDMIFTYQKCVDEDFVRKHEDKWLDRKNGLFCSNILENIKFSEEFLREYRKILGWDFIFKSQKVDTDLIREFKDEINWNDFQLITSFCFKKRFNDFFLEEFKNYIGWHNISTLGFLSADFLHKYKESINWEIYEFCGKINFMLDFIREEE